MAGLPSGTVTLVFSDIEGSTRLVHRLGPAYPEVLAAHRDVMRNAFSAGIEVETRGDSFLFVFESARTAVGAAIEAQRARATHIWPEGGRVRVRIGVHAGEPEQTGDGYVGLDVHRAARIGDAGNSGQVVVSDTTRALVGDEFALRELGEYRLAGLEQPERLYDVIVDG